MTRSDENGISGLEKGTIREKHRGDLRNRVRIGNESGADIFVSIHLNKIPQKQYSGWQAFFKEGNESSTLLAKSIQAGIGQSIGQESKRQAAKIKGIYIVNHVTIPITIVECGFLSNYEETKLLLTEEYQEKLARGIYLGIVEYFRNIDAE